jgi:hypothetical protein
MGASDRKISFRDDSMITGPASQHFSTIIEKWRELAEKRRLSLVELQRNGRWKIYYTEAQFALRLAQASQLAQAWEVLAASSVETATAHLPPIELDAARADYPVQRNAA